MADHDNPKAGVVRRTIKTLLYAVVAVLGVLAAYLTAAVAGTLWTVSGHGEALSEQPRVVYVLSNGFHSDIALPVENGRLPAGLPVRDKDFPNGLDQARYLIIGWGSQSRI
ncbi:DUF2459 domain-containing protein [Hoeflea sp.]|uniref:DUF2459 domain-containing protein n=1 Tax=Hoeflea sp. TaxID=1940281 RepID=UPI003B02D97C